ncbi:cytochrome P450 71D6-like [Coffea arabica]|uniref:Cytochrome P450 71D6-like n=1 Tax=Coffea arabica TaxID=13443 RepID=A0ABM4WMG2_COFAR
MMMDLTSNFIACFLVLAVVTALIKKCKRSKASQKLPPSPWKLPFVGHLHHLLGCPPYRALAKLAQKHGALMHLQLGEISSIVVSSPRLAREILKTHDLALSDRAEILASKIIVVGPTLGTKIELHGVISAVQNFEGQPCLALNRAGTVTLMTVPAPNPIVCYDSTNIAGSPYGPYWRQMRKICTMKLLGPEKVQSFGSIMQDEAWHLISSIQALSVAGAPINLTEKLSSYTSSMVFRAAFGKVSRQHKDTFLQVLKQALPLSGEY